MCMSNLPKVNRVVCMQELPKRYDYAEGIYYRVEGELSVC